jgi:pseudaminic acid cytidylyltransferase
MNIAIIPARGGSKRIHRKNIRDFHGKPIIGWTIEKCLASNCFDKIVVSTDDDEIAEVARTYGAETPFMRPAKLSDDHATTLDVMEHATNQLLSAGITPEYICCVYATAPFFTVEEITAGLRAIHNGRWQYALSVTEFPSSVYRGFVQTEVGGLEMLYPQFRLTRSQDLKKVYHDAAQFYWGTTQAWLLKADVFSNHSTPVFIPSWRVQDIDTEDDFKRAELLFKLMHNESAFDLGDKL